MKILIACEFSGTVRDAFIRRGHDAISCDLLPSDAPGPHYQGDVRDIINDGFDLMIAHPPCTYLCSSGMHWTARGLRDRSLTDGAIEFVRMLMDAPIDKIALENPVGVLSTAIRKPDQIIQPWMFGHCESKSTCLWLKGLPNLIPTKIMPPIGYENVVFADELPLCDLCGEPFCEKHGEHYADCSCVGPMSDDATIIDIKGFLFGSRLEPAPKPRWSNQTASGQNRLAPSPNRWKERSKTYAGIAEAMAEQWGNLV